LCVIIKATLINILSFFPSFCVQWNSVYKAFDRIRFCENKIIVQQYSLSLLEAVFKEVTIILPPHIWPYRESTFVQEKVVFDLIKPLKCPS